MHGVSFWPLFLTSTLLLNADLSLLLLLPSCRASCQGSPQVAWVSKEHPLVLLFLCKSSVSVHRANPSESPVLLPNKSALCCAVWLGLLWATCGRKLMGPWSVAAVTHLSRCCTSDLTWVCPIRPGTVCPAHVSVKCSLIVILQEAGTQEPSSCP